MPSGHSVSCLCHLPGNSYRNDIPIIFAGRLDITSNDICLGWVSEAFWIIRKGKKQKKEGKFTVLANIYTRETGDCDAVVSR